LMNSTWITGYCETVWNRAQRDIALPEEDFRRDNENYPHDASLNLILPVRPEAFCTMFLCLRRIVHYSSLLTAGIPVNQFVMQTPPRKEPELPPTAVEVHLKNQGYAPFMLHIDTIHKGPVQAVQQLPVLWSPF